MRGGTRVLESAGKAGPRRLSPSRPWSGHRSPLNYYVPGLVSYAWAAMTLPTIRTGRPRGDALPDLSPKAPVEWAICRTMKAIASTVWTRTNQDKIRNQGYPPLAPGAGSR